MSIVTKHLLDQASSRGQKLVFTAASRNIIPISEALKGVFSTYQQQQQQSPPDANDATEDSSACRESGSTGAVLLEIGSGSGQHLVHLAKMFPEMTFQPTDIEPSYMQSILAYREEEGLSNIMDPAPLDCLAAHRTASCTAGSERAMEDVCAGVKRETCDFVYASNVAHIAPWEVTLGLVAIAGHALKRGGRLLIYGPFAIDGVLEPESNRLFNERLKQKDQSYGVRDVRDIEKEGMPHGLVLDDIVDMPSNNKIIMFTKD